MQDFSHPHIMSLIGVCLDAGVGVVMPFMANGSVLNYLKKERKALLLSEEAEIEQVKKCEPIFHCLVSIHPSMSITFCLSVQHSQSYLALMLIYVMM